METVLKITNIGNQNNTTPAVTTNHRQHIESGNLCQSWSNKLL